MLSPGSKGWINKYFDLVQSDNFSLNIDRPKNIEKEAYIHAVLGESGVIFGYPTKLIFARKINDSKWTTDEKLKLLVFESFLLIYKLHFENQNFQKAQFIEALIDFYGKHGSSTIKKAFSFFIKESNIEKMENTFSKRIDIKTNFLENNLWINYLNNCFIFLDLILFNEYLKNENKNTIHNYNDYALNALTIMTLAAYSDGVIDKYDENVFKAFLASANLPENQREIAWWRFKKGATLADLSPSYQENWLMKHFMLDLSVYVILADSHYASEERAFLDGLVAHIGFTSDELNRSMALTEQFILNNHDKISILKNSSSVEKIYSNLSKRWLKILGRNKDKLAVELKQSKELVALIRKSRSSELTKEEKDLVKTQFKDIVKSMPSLAIFMLPGGTVLLPLLVKIVPDILPSAFRENELEKQEEKQEEKQDK
jgi:hypothetical protein